jgi:hypothetical protein
VLKRLICFSGTVEYLKLGLKEISWDTDEVPLEFEAAHLINVLHGYLAGRLTAKNVEDWANLIEGREDLEYEAAFSEKIKQCIYVLANPYLVAPLSAGRAEELIKSLEEKGVD